MSNSILKYVDHGTSTLAEFCDLNLKLGADVKRGNTKKKKKSVLPFLTWVADVEKSAEKRMSTIIRNFSYLSKTTTDIKKNKCFFLSIVMYNISAELQLLIRKIHLIDVE